MPCSFFPRKNAILILMDSFFHPPFAADHLRDEAACVNILLSALQRDGWDDTRVLRVRLQAERFIRHIRGHKCGLGDIETVLEHFPLESPEGLALMTLAEALLRVPDAATADALIAEKIAAAKWKTRGKTGGMLKLASIGMRLARRALRSSPGDLERALIRKGMEEAIGRIGQQFVLGEDIAAAFPLRKNGNTGDIACPMTCWAKARVRQRMPKGISRDT